MLNRALRIVAAGFASAGCFCGAAYASEGLNLIGVDALQLGRADSGTASPRSAYWQIMNPGALTEFEERRVDITTFVVFEKIRLNPEGVLGNPFDGTLKADGVAPVPSSGLVSPMKDGKSVLALGVYPAGGGKVEYNKSRSSLGRLLFHNKDRKNALQHVQLSLAYARKLGDNGWSLGVGIQPSITRLRTNQLTLNLRPADGGNHWDEALGIGFNVGVYKEWGEKFAWGATYKSRQWSGKFDNYRDLVPEALDYPHAFRTGVAWMPVDRWTVTLDYEYQMWSKAPPFSDNVLESGLEWDDIHAYKIGLEYVALRDHATNLDKLILMAGYSYSDTVVDDDHAFVNAFVPTLIQNHITAGVTWNIRPNHSLHAVYVRSVENELVQSRSGDLLGRLAAGSELTVSAHSFAFGYSWKF